MFSLEIHIQMMHVYCGWLRSHSIGGGTGGEGGALAPQSHSNGAFFQTPLEGVLHTLSCPPPPPPPTSIIFWAGGWAGLGWAGLGWAGLGWAGLGWAGLGWAGLGWAGLGWVGLDWSRSNLGDAVPITAMTLQLGWTS